MSRMFSFLTSIFAYTSKLSFSTAEDLLHRSDNFDKLLV
uniref:Uncharacterized protein n=1 Tax=Anguilla anguilla TaxID=7936 RepID=A0A0E9PW90_ANGAN